VQPMANSHANFFVPYFLTKNLNRLFLRLYLLLNKFRFSILQHGEADLLLLLQYYQF
jgi:hypothetical protein